MSEHGLKFIIQLNNSNNNNSNNNTSNTSNNITPSPLKRYDSTLYPFDEESDDDEQNQQSD